MSRSIRFGTPLGHLPGFFVGDAIRRPLQAEHLNYFQVQLGFELVDYTDREAFGLRRGIRGLASWALGNLRTRTPEGRMTLPYFVPVVLDFNIAAF